MIYDLRFTIASGVLFVTDTFNHLPHAGEWCFHHLKLRS